MISVTMLTYNRETFVARAIESVFAQTFRDFEFIIVDNGSTDSGGAIADEYAAKD
jgi:glycosyltransferase involved in cell wall biosynthesis